jgi:hypothetical protein
MFTIEFGLRLWRTRWRSCKYLVFRCLKIVSRAEKCSICWQDEYNLLWLMVYVIQVCRQLSSNRIRVELQFHSDPARKLPTNLYDIYHCCVYSENSWWWKEELSETRRVSFQNKFEKFVHIVGFILKKFVTMHGHMSRCTVTCHDARSHVTMHGHMNVKENYCLRLHVIVLSEEECKYGLVTNSWVLLKTDSSLIIAYATNVWRFPLHVMIIYRRILRGCMSKSTLGVSRWSR